ncbi:MAG: hypothetical protein NZ937_05015 [Armatimonadetes bacterium]|nr:hypothetical protein [Armatimonadota bacterium]
MQFVLPLVCNPQRLTPSSSSSTDILGKEAFLTMGVFAWSLNGDYEIDRPFLCFRKTKGQKLGFTFKLA